jgi:hypothetical protein
LHPRASHGYIASLTEIEAEVWMSFITRIQRSAEFIPQVSRRSTDTRNEFRAPPAQLLRGKTKLCADEFPYSH